MAENGSFGDDSVAKYLKILTYDLKQDIVLIGSPPPLTYLTHVRVAINIWYKKLLLNESRVLLRNQMPLTVRNYTKELEKTILNLKIPIECKRSLSFIITLIGNNLINFFAGQVGKFLELSNLKICLDNIVWTRQGTINTIKSVTNFIENMEFVSFIEKFKLSCNYCLKDKIIYYLQTHSELYKLPDDIDIIPKINHLVVYWILHINKSLDKFSIIAEGDPTYVYLLKWAIAYKSECAVQYIWENYADKSMIERVLEFANLTIFCHGYDRMGYNPMRILFYFFTHMNKTQINNLHINLHLCIIMKVYTISKYCNLISISKYVIEIIKNLGHLESLHLLKLCLQKSILNIVEFNIIWEEMVILKPAVKSDFLNICNTFFWSTLCEMKTMNFAKYILKLGSSEDVKAVIYNKYSISTFLRQFQFRAELINAFFNRILNENDIYEYKIKLLENINFLNHILFGNYQILDNYLNSFCVEIKISEFKRNLAYTNRASIIFSILRRNPSISHYYDQIKLINEFIIWCFDGNKKEMARCKITIFNLETNLFKDIKKVFFKKLHILIQRNEWKLAEYYLSFIFYATEKKIYSQIEKLKRFKKIIYFMYGERCITYDMNKRSLLLFVYKRPSKQKSLDLKICSEFNKIKTLLMISIESSLLFKLVKHFDIQDFGSLLRWVHSAFKYINSVKAGCNLSLDATKKEIQFQQFFNSENYQLIKHNNQDHKMYYLFDWFCLSDLSMQIDFIFDDK